MKEFPNSEEIEKMEEAYKRKIAQKVQERMNNSPEFKEKCESSSKTLTGILKYCKEEARKQAKDGVAVIDDEEVYQWAYHYIEEDSLDCEEKPKPPVVKKVKKEDQKDLFSIEPEKDKDDSDNDNESTDNDEDENEDEDEENIFSESESESESESKSESKPEVKLELVQNVQKEEKKEEKVPEKVSQLSLFGF